MGQNDLALLGHLLRRIGFGATRDELERYSGKGYEETVEELLHPEQVQPAFEEEDLLRRYHVEHNADHLLPHNQTYWLSRMINTKRPLEEKVALFWHGVFATGYSKITNAKAGMSQLEMFRRCGLGSFHTLLLQLSKNPAMIFWLDNNNNHGNAVNENFGRELLELFSMGVGNYTEDDVRQASRAFTGWTMHDAEFQAFRVDQDLQEPFMWQDWRFEYRADDHDDGEKTFLGHTGRFNGEDIIDIICQQQATARFVARHLYNFFVADEAQVPAWNTVPPREPEAIATLTGAYFEHSYEIRSVLRVLFNSDFFKRATFARVKSPAELVVGTARMAGGFEIPEANHFELAERIDAMGQALTDPPSVEGWYTGKEWITTANLSQRVDFAVQQFSDVDRPGVRSIIDRIRAQGSSLSPEHMVDACLDQIGPIEVGEGTRQELISHASSGGELRFGTDEEDRLAAERVKSVLQLIVSSPEYQMA